MDSESLIEFFIHILFALYDTTNICDDILKMILIPMLIRLTKHDQV